MNDYEKSFVLKIERVTRDGVDFESLTRQALGGWFGGATDVLLKDLSPSALREPESFVQEMSRLFGRGAMGIFQPITRFVDLGLYHHDGNSAMAELIGKLGPPQGNLADPKKILLHEHRIKDEQGNYPDNAD